MASDAQGSGGARRLAILGPSCAALVEACGPFIQAMTARGSHLLAMAPGLSASNSEALAKLGAEPATLTLKPDGYTLFPQRRAISALAAKLAQWNPHAVLALGEAVVPLAVMASRRARVARISVLIDEMPERGISNRLRAAIKVAGAVIVTNSDDERAVRSAAQGGAAEIVRVPGIGANLASAPGSAMPEPGEPVIFLAACRLERGKGVHDYLEAARLAHETKVAAKFLLAGPDGTGEGALKPETLTRYAHVVNYVGDRADLNALIAQSHVFVCASHREGMPGAVLTAMAAGRPVIATDIAGARDTVDEMVNGTLVPPGDAVALSAAFQRLVRNRALLPAMSRASRAKAERKFSSADVHSALAKALDLL